jgi:hypothetical protein
MIMTVVPTFDTSQSKKVYVQLKLMMRIKIPDARLVEQVGGAHQVELAMNLDKERRWIESEDQDAVNRKGRRLAAHREDGTSGHTKPGEHTPTRLGLSGDNDEDYSTKGDSDSDDGNAGGLTEMFADPDPLDTFRFQFDLNCRQDGDDGDNGRELSGACGRAKQRIEISLVGYKAELGQTLHSTGLTLWRASSLLCDFLVQNPSYIRQKAVVEVCGHASAQTGFHYPDLLPSSRPWCFSLF